MLLTVCERGSDSAIATYEHFVNTPRWGRVAQDALNLPGILQRLGELYEAKGDAAKAALYYGKFVDLWKHANPELQPRVTDIRQRMAHLTDAPKSVALPKKP